MGPTASGCYAAGVPLADLGRTRRPPAGTHRRRPGFGRGSTTIQWGDGLLGQPPVFLRLALSVPSEDDLNELDWDKIKRHLSRISKQFNLWPEMDCSGRLEAVPSAISLKDHLGHRFYHAAVLGSFQSKDGAILGDLDALATLDLVEGVAAAFAEGTHLPTPTEESTASRE